MALNKIVTILLLAIASTSWIQALPMLSAGEGYKLLSSIRPDGSNDIDIDLLVKDIHSPLNDDDIHAIAYLGILINLDDLIPRDSTRPRDTTGSRLRNEELTYLPIASERAQKAIEDSKVLSDEDKARCYVRLIYLQAKHTKEVVEVTQNPSPSSSLKS